MSRHRLLHAPPGQAGLIAVHPVRSEGRPRSRDNRPLPAATALAGRQAILYANPFRADTDAAMRPQVAIPLLLCALAALWLTACATMNQDDCLSADWYALGLEAGSQGENRDHLERQRAECHRHGVAVDGAAWLEGYEYGLEDFCIPANGYEYGRRGRTYGGVCPAHLEGGFLLGYQQGRTLYDAEQQVARIDRTLQDRVARIDEARYHLYHYEKILNRKDSSDEERRYALANVRYLQRDIAVLRREIRELDLHRVTAERHLMQVQAQGIQGW